jgi:hypothetical protein
MIKIVINICHGGFSLSPKATLECYKRGMKGMATTAKSYFKSTKRPSAANTALTKWRQYLAGEKIHGYLTVFSPNEKHVLSTHFGSNTILRADPILVSVVEEFGQSANGEYAELTVVKWPDRLPWTIREYDGFESVEIDTDEVEKWLQFATENEGMRDLLERCQVYYSLAVKDK